MPIIDALRARGLSGVALVNQYGESLDGYGYSSGRVTVTRPANATPYGALDVVGATAAAVTFPNVGPALGGEVLLRSFSLEIQVAAIPASMTTFSLHLYNVTPPSALADNAVFDIPAGDRAAHIGKITTSTIIDEGSTLKVFLDGLTQQVTVPVGGSLFGYLVTTAGFTPAGNSEVYVLTLKTQSA